MKKLDAIEMEKVMTDMDTCRKEIIELSGNYKSRQHFEILTQSVISSVNSTVNSILYSTEELQGEFVICDEISPIKLTKYLMELKNYQCNEEILSYYVAHYLKRKINEFYLGLRKNEISVGVNVGNTPKSYKRYLAICNDRKANDMKIIRCGGK